MKKIRCIDCQQLLTKRVTYSGEFYQVAKPNPRCGKCYLRNRRSFRFRREVTRLTEQIGTDFMAAIILEESR